jgi:hypothetical protein
VPLPRGVLRPTFDDMFLEDVVKMCECAGWVGPGLGDGGGVSRMVDSPDEARRKAKAVREGKARLIGSIFVISECVRY